MDLLTAIYEQLPEATQAKFHLDVDTDTYWLRCAAKFRAHKDGRVFTTVLEGDPRFDGLCVKIPDQFISLLLLVG